VAKKGKEGIPVPGDVGSSFEDDHDILNFRPDIFFVSPEPEPSEATGETTFTDDDLGARKQDTEDLISRYDAVAELIDMAEERIDQRVEALGGLTIQLDPKVDGPTIAAMKRMFPDNPFPTQITYGQYKHALKTVTGKAKDPPGFGPLDIKHAQENPLKTDFGALSLQPGMGRPEITSGSQILEPISLPDFILAAVMALFTMLISMIIDLIKSVVGIP
jgi:hypothetical protein